MAEKILLYFLHWKNGYECICPQESSIPLVSVSCLLSTTLFITSQQQIVAKGLHTDENISKTNRSTINSTNNTFIQVKKPKKINEFLGDS